MSSTSQLKKLLTQVGVINDGPSLFKSQAVKDFPCENGISLALDRNKFGQL